MANGQIEDVPPPYSERRIRIRLSCTHCREKKLKCNRQQPCDNCTKRSQGSSCRYAAYPEGQPNRNRRSTRKAEVLQSRIHDLEQLVQSLRNNPQQSAEKARLANEGAAGQHQLQTSATNGSSIPGDTENEVVPSGKVVIGPDGKRYVDDTHWQAILDNIAKVTDDLKGYDDDDGEEEAEVNASVLLTGQHNLMILRSLPSATREELQSYLPDRQVADRLIYRIFNSKEALYAFIHIPTFMKEYNEFWKDPQSKSTSWLGLLFIALSHACFIFLRVREALPGNFEDPFQVVEMYRMRAVQCLILDEYTKPGRYKIETLFMYFGTEYIKNTDANLGASTLLAMIIRLAMHMGYHRDPDYFDEISPFEGEMRRRIWTVIMQIDQLVSFQVGIPKTIPVSGYDTKPPRNLRDTDFDESTQQLPPSRDDSDHSPVLYHIVKYRLMMKFGDIVTAVSSWNSNTRYEDVMRLDSQLKSTHSSFPAILHIKPISQCLMDPAEIIMQRYNLDLLYQKSRCILHRKYFLKARVDPRYTYPRWACIDAAKQILHHQLDLNQEIKPGGLLFKESWFVNSLTTSDFLLAAVILCLDISHDLVDLPHSPYTNGYNDVKQMSVGSQKDIISLLQKSCDIWEQSRGRSMEANRAYLTLSSMLNKVTRRTAYWGCNRVEAAPQPNPSNALTLVEETQMMQLGQSNPSIYVNNVAGYYPPYAYSDLGTPGSSQYWGSASAYTPDPSGSVPYTDTLMDFDWSAFDLQVQNGSADVLDIPWMNTWAPNGSC